MSNADFKTKNLGQATTYVIRNDMSEIMNDFFKHDVVLFTKSSLKSVSKLLKLPIDLVQITKRDGIKETVLNLAKKSKDLSFFIIKLPGRLKLATNDLIMYILLELELAETKKEQTLFILKFFSYLSSFIIGTVLGNSIPDKDIKIFGIGKHRNILTHSIIILIAIKLLAQFSSRFLDKINFHYSEESDEYELFQVIKNNIAAIAFGTSLGLAGHLLIDGTLQPSGTIRGPGFNSLLMKGTIDDQCFLVINSFFSTLIGKDILEENAETQKEKIT